MTTRLRPVLLVGLLVLQALTVIGVVIVTGRTTEGLLIDEMRETMRLAATSLNQRTADHLAPAEDAADLGADLLAHGVLPVDDDAVLQTYLDDQLAASPSITGAYVGRPDGSFVLVSRDGATEAGGSRVKTITVGPDGRTSTTVQRDRDGTEVTRADDPTDTYDPRARPWYEAAVGSEGTVWTEPYVFFASEEPGVTTAEAARGPDGEVLAVFGVDLSLRDLSDFVGRIRVSPASRAVLVDEAGLMVASGDLAQVVEPDGTGAFVRASVLESTDPVLSAGVGAVMTRTDGAAPDELVVVPFEVDGRDWQVAVVPLDERQPWFAAVAAPEEEFVSEVVDAQRRNALLAVAISLGVVVLALPAVAVVTRRVDRMAEHALTDPLTGLPNRRRHDELLADHLADARPGRPLCVATIDVDHFKAVNDTHGHGVGDEVLVTIARRLRGALRDHDVVARVGGDEFAAILVDTPLDVAVEALERARHAVCDEPARTTKGPVPISVTIGVAETTGVTGDDHAALAERADLALYVAKEAGRNAVATPDGVVGAPGVTSRG